MLWIVTQSVRKEPSGLRDNVRETRRRDGVRVPIVIQPRPGCRRLRVNGLDERLRMEGISLCLGVTGTQRFFQRTRLGWTGSLWRLHPSDIEQGKQERIWPNYYNA